MRLFCAVKLHPTPPIRNLVEQLTWMNKLFKTVKTDPLHLTLRFFGETDQETAAMLAARLDELAANHRWFNLHLRGLGAFPALPPTGVANLRHLPRVIFIDVVTPSPITALAAALAEPDDQPFTAHVTLARHRPHSRPHSAQRQRLMQWLNEHRRTDFGCFPVRHLSLIESELTPRGPIHTVRHSAPLLP